MNDKILKWMFSHNKEIILKLLVLILFTSCSHKQSEQKEEQIRVEAVEEKLEGDSSGNSIKGNVSMSQIATTPNAVILTGLDEHRLVTIYKSKKANPNSAGLKNYFKSSYDYNDNNSEFEEHFMPGIDILYGYNLLNIAHYNIKLEKLDFFFNRPSLIKTVYFPSYVQDSVNKVPITRNYYLVSVYDQDTNKDSMINKRDLRRFYHIDADNSKKTVLVPSNYSVIRSQYDSKNDMMYLFASCDENKNGTRDSQESIHIFWIDLKQPSKAKRLF
jgi:hypothetical protein